MQEIEYRSQLPHRPYGPSRQLRRRGRPHQRCDDLTALLLLLWRLVASLLLLLRLTRRRGSRRRLEPSRGTNGARARWTVTPIDGRSWGSLVLLGGGIFFRIGVGVIVLRRRGSVVRDRRRGGLSGHVFGGDQVGLQKLWRITCGGSWVCIGEQIRASCWGCCFGVWKRKNRRRQQKQGIIDKGMEDQRSKPSSNRFGNVYVCVEFSFSFCDGSEKARDGEGGEKRTKEGGGEERGSRVSPWNLVRSWILF